MTSTSSFLPLSPPRYFSLFSQSRLQTIYLHPHSVLRIHTLQPFPLLQASLRIPNLNQESNNLVNDRRNWSRSSARGVYYDDEEDDDVDEGDRSLDLLVRFMHNVFKKISRRAGKAVRSVLPLSISNELVTFSVDGVIMLTFLQVLKAFLEVVCTLGSVVFVSILLLRGMWSGLSYLQESRIYKTNELDDGRAWTGAQPVT